MSASSPSSSVRRPVWVQPAPSLTKAISRQRKGSPRAALFIGGGQITDLHRAHVAVILPAGDRAVSPIGQGFARAFINLMDAGTAPGIR